MATRLFDDDLYSPGVRDPWIRLAAAVMACATRQAQKGPRTAENVNAILWLRTEPAELIADALGIDPERVQAWAAAIDLCPNGGKKKTKAGHTSHARRGIQCTEQK